MRKREYDAKVKPRQFEIGQWVWYYYPRRYSYRSPKWNKIYGGPFLVVGKIPPCDYVIQKTKKSSLQVVHGNKLKQCVSQTPTSWITPKDDQLKATNVQSTGETSVLTGSQGRPQEYKKWKIYSAAIENAEKKRLPIVGSGRLGTSKMEFTTKSEKPTEALMDYQFPSSHLQY